MDKKIVMKQTAVEYLNERFTYIKWMRDRDEISSETGTKWYNEALEQANKMFEQQIIDAHLTGLIHPLEMEATKQSEQYYNETYK